jgi:carbon monoxide dehydrogenase subunit G
MATVRRSVHVAVDPDVAWAALRDVGAVHTRLARGFVTDCRLEGDVRQVTFANGMTLPERIVAVDDETRRVVWTIPQAPYDHHNGSAQVIPADGGTRVEWIADLLPDSLAPGYADAMERGLAAIKATLEKA